MKKEYDFSRGERGRFYNPDAKLNLPVYAKALKGVAVPAAQAARQEASDAIKQVQEPIRRKLGI